MTTATIITPDDRPAWLAERKNGIGASEAAAALGVSPYETPLELYLRKTGQIAEREPTEAMQMGLLLEPVLVDLYQRRTGRRIVAQQVFLRRPEQPHLFATIDARCEDGGLIELKTISAWKGRDLGESDSDELPDPWIVQAHQQMHVAEQDEVGFGVLIGGQEFRTFTVRRNERLLDAMLWRLLEFCTRLRERVPPPPDLPRDAPLLRVLRPGAEGAVALSPHVARAAESYFDLGREISALTKAREHAKAVLESEMAGHAAGVLPDGRVLNRKVIPIKPRVVTLDDCVRSGGVVTIARGYDRVDLRLKGFPSEDNP